MQPLINNRTWHITLHITVRKIIYKWNTLKTAEIFFPGVEVPASSPQGQNKSLRATSQTLQASVSMVNVKGHGLFGRVSGESLIRTNIKTSGTTSFEHMRPKWRCLVITNSSMFEQSTSAQTSHTNCQARWWRADDLGLFYSHRTWTPCRRWVKPEVLCIPKYSSQMWLELKLDWIA